MSLYMHQIYSWFNLYINLYCIRAKNWPTHYIIKIHFVKQCSQRSGPELPYPSFFYAYQSSFEHFRFWNIFSMTIIVAFLQFKLKVLDSMLCQFVKYFTIVFHTTPKLYWCKTKNMIALLTPIAQKSFSPVIVLKNMFERIDKIEKITG